MKKSTAATHHTARQGLGRTGERLAAEALMDKGYHILERNFRCRHGEIDLVAQDEHELVFVEVKTRPGSLVGSGLRAEHLLQGRTCILFYLHGLSLSRIS